MLICKFYEFNVLSPKFFSFELIRKLITHLFSFSRIQHNAINQHHPPDPAFKLCFNSETAGSNSFQHELSALDKETISKKASEEFETFAATLESKGVGVLIFDDTPSPEKPDAIFPNNWISFHSDGTVILYPMFAQNRREERRNDIVAELKKIFNITNVVDLSGYEKENKFLEGTGSMVFDHENKIVYACLSPRTDKELFIKVAEILHYKPVYFRAKDRNGKEIYHTNVMMCIGEKFAVICLDSIADKNERNVVSHSLVESGHEIIEITNEQMNHFAGNMLALQTNSNKNILVSSQSAFDSLNANQKKEIEKYCELLPLPIKTIETIGGGSARCMIAEIFLQRQN